MWSFPLRRPLAGADGRLAKKVDVRLDAVRHPETGYSIRGGVRRVPNAGGIRTVPPSPTLEGSDAGIDVVEGRMEHRGFVLGGGNQKRGVLGRHGEQAARGPPPQICDGSGKEFRRI